MKLLTAILTLSILMLATVVHSRENLPDTATWQDVFDEYSENGYPDYMGEIQEGAEGFITIALPAGASGGELETIAPDIVPPPWCLDLYGCVNPNSTHEEQREQNRLQWFHWCACEPPDAYGHTGHGDNARTYIVYGDNITVYRPDGTIGDVSELYNSLPDCPDDWDMKALVGAAYGSLASLAAGVYAGAGVVGIAGITTAAAVVLGSKVVAVGLAVTTIGAAGYVVYCYHAEGV